jgi:hypothetical protein
VLRRVLLLWLGWIETCLGFWSFITTDLYIDDGWIGLKHIAVLDVDLLHISVQISTNMSCESQQNFINLSQTFQDSKLLMYVNVVQGFYKIMVEC